jgi:hypothetical protein
MEMAPQEPIDSFATDRQLGFTVLEACRRGPAMTIAAAIVATYTPPRGYGRPARRDRDCPG